MSTQADHTEHLWNLVRERLRYAEGWKLSIDPWGLYGCVSAKLTTPSGGVLFNQGQTLSKRLAWALGHIPAFEREQQ